MNVTVGLGDLSKGFAINVALVVMAAGLVTGSFVFYLVVFFRNLNRLREQEKIVEETVLLVP
jgi:hypothetical protein